MTSSDGLVVLDCKHEPRFKPSPPAPGEEVYCVYCRRYRIVVSRTLEISIRCRGCKLSRRHGVGGDGDLTLHDARRLASGHVTRYPQHVVDVTDTDGEVYVIADDGQGELPFAAEMERRTGVSRTQAVALRGAFNRARNVVEPRSP